MEYCASEFIRPVEVRSRRLVAKRMTKAEAGFPNTTIPLKRYAVDDSVDETPIHCPPEGNIAAIDFGTTYSSLAFITEGDDKGSCIKMNNHYARVPNAILLRKTEGRVSNDRIPCNVVSYGYTAQNKYSRLSTQEVESSLYFERIKMNLQHDQNVNRQMTIKAHNGDDYYLIEVIAFMLQTVKEILVDHLSRTDNPLQAADLNWVITVPAIWQARGRGMMREAAYMAGLCADTGMKYLSKVGRKLEQIHKTNHAVLTLAPEPDAAALYCQKVAPIAAYCDNVSGETASKQYIVVDIGGGTVDITAQRSCDKGIEVLKAPTGNSWGGTTVNRELVKLVQKIVKENGDPSNLETAFPRYFSKVRNPAIRKAELVKAFYWDFDSQKKGFGDKADVPVQKCDDDLVFEMPNKFREFYNLEDCEWDETVYIEEENIFINYQKVEELFKPAINGILQCTKAVLSELKSKIDTIYLIGGFGGCRYVYQHIHHMVKTEFSRYNYKIIVPVDCHLAVALGAITFRQHKTPFKSRVMEATYGLAVSVPFEEGVHPDEYYKLDEDGKNPLCTDIFLTFIEEGEVTQATEVVVDDIVPLVDNVREVRIPIYRSFCAGLHYITERSGAEVTNQAERVGELLFDIPRDDITHKSQRKFRIIFDFSGTEIKVYARYLSNQPLDVGVALDFLTHSK